MRRILDFQVVPEAELVGAQAGGSPAVAVMDMSSGQWVGGYPIPSGVQPYGIASVTPHPLRQIVPIRPSPLPEPFPSAPPTTMFILNGAAGNSALAPSVLAVFPSLSDLAGAVVTTAISLAQSARPQQNGLAVYQKSVPAGGIYLGPALPIYVYVLVSAQNGETVLRYQMNSSPPYQPAGLTGSATDPTFIAANSTVSGVGTVLSTYSLVQGLACSGDGILAVSDGSLIWLFDAESGAFAGAGAIDLAPWNLSASTLAFGPDGNLYVLAGPSAASASVGWSPTTVLRFYGSTAIPMGANAGNPTLIAPAQLAGISGAINSVGMTVGGGPSAPVVYLCSGDQYAITSILTFNGNTGIQMQNTLQGIGSLNAPVALAIVGFYALKEFPIRPI
jgi:hypothetical protein